MFASTKSLNVLGTDVQICAPEGIDSLRSIESFRRFA
jgi:hypothetical protein